MLKFNNLTLKNFISVGAVTQAVDISVNGLTLILGQHTDAEGAVTRNGAGKSTILQAISYALYGQALAKIKVDNLINDVNGKAMLVTLEFEKNGSRYRIERGRKPAVLKFFVNDVELKKDDTNDSKGDSADTQDDINDVVGMDHTMFCHILALNTLTIPFLKSPAGTQREVMEKLLGATQLSERAKVLSKKITATKDDIKLLEAKVIASLESNKRIESSIAAAKQKISDWDFRHTTNVRQVEDAISKLAAIDIDAELEILAAIERYDSDLKAIEGAIALKTRELDLLEREKQSVAREAEATARELARMKVEAERDDPQGIIPRLKQDEQSISFDISSHERLTKTLDQRLEANKTAIDNANGSSCSACGQGLEGTDHLDRILANLQKERTSIEQDIGIANEKTVLLADKLSKARGATLEAETLLSEQKAERIAAYEEKAKTIASQPGANTSEIDAALIVIANEMAEYSDARKALGGRPVSAYRSQKELYAIKQDREALETEATRLASEVNPHLDQIGAFESAIIQIDPTPLEDAQKLLKHQDYLLKLLTKPDSFIRQKIINQNLHNLNQRLVHYCEKLMLPHQVVFNSDMTVDITKLGRDYDFEQLSRGEGNRLIMAISLSFRDLWEMLNVSTNLLFVDELLDSGLDQTGAEAALQVLKGLARDRNKNVFLISHKEELRGRIDRTLLVSKEDGFSRFEFDGF